MENVPVKRCRICRESKPLTEFNKARKRKDGLRASCRTCANKYHNMYRDMTFSTSPAAYVAGGMFWNARNRARRSGLAFDLDRADIIERTARGYCEMTGIPFSFSHGVGINSPDRWNSPSIDRIDPSRGYVQDNIRVVIFALNTFMGNWGEEVALGVAREWLAREGAIVIQQRAETAHERLNRLTNVAEVV